MKTIYELVMRSDILRRDVDRFAYVNRLTPNSTEYDSYMMGYVRAVEDIYNCLALNNHLIIEMYEKQQLTTK